MKLLVIHGSPHKGQTYDATMDFLETLRAHAAVDVGEIHLFQEHLESCKGCGTCVTRGEEKCPIRDKLLEIHGMMREADAIVVTTPVYALHVTALVKIFLERSSYLIHRPCFFGKWFMSLSTQYIGGDRDVARYLASVMRFLGFNIIPGLRLTMSQNKNVRDKEIRDAARRFAAVASRNALPAPALNELMKFRFRRRFSALESYSQTFPRDLEYFKGQGWLESDYYYPVRLGPFKRMAGNLFDTIATRMMENI